MTPELRSPFPKQVFADSSGLIGYFDADDQYYLSADRRVQEFIRNRTTLVITNFVRAETHAFLVGHVGYLQAIRFLDAVESGAGITVAGVKPVDIEKALIIIRQYRDHGFSFCDAISFAVMQRLHRKHAFSYDRHFNEYDQFIILH